MQVMMGTHRMLHTRAAAQATGTRPLFAQVHMRDLQKKAAQPGTTTIGEAKAVETRKAAGRVKDIMRGREPGTENMAEKAKEI